MAAVNGIAPAVGGSTPSGCAERLPSSEIPRGYRVSYLSSRLLISRMGCCGCSDETVSKVVPATPDQEEPSLGEPERVFTTDRSCTDVIALFVLVILIGGFGFFVTTTMKKGDINRMINGYDDCANVCGRKTLPETNPLFSCKGADKTNFPYLLINVGTSGVKSRECVKSCPEPEDQIVFLNRCVPKKLTESTNSVIRSLGLQSFFYEASRDLSIAWREMIYLLLIALAISLGILIAFRYIVQWVIYIVLSSSVVVSTGGAIYLWIAWHQEKQAVALHQITYEEDSSVTSYMIYAILMSIVAVVVVLVVLVMRTRIALVVQLFKEAGKAVYAMPALLLQPIYTYLLIGLSLVVCMYFMLWIESSGDLYKNRKNHLHYRKDAFIITARWYNIFVYFVMCEFFLGCQHVIVAGAVARWFFTRDKKRLSLAVTRSTCSLLRFHLGTVAFGAMIIGIVRLIRAILAFIQNRLKGWDNDFARGMLWCCQCCMWCFECALKFLTRNAYIETAIYGCGFCKGGQKAFQALSSNVLRVAAINSVGDFVLFLGKVVVVALTVISGIYLIQKKHGLHHPWVPITLAGILAFIVAHCFISIYEMIIDTIFICFCEDCAKNDGISRPYYMSRGLMEFVENSKKALRHLDEQRVVTT